MSPFRARLSFHACLLAAMLLLGAVSTARARGGPGGSVGGRLVDESGAVLPGVTVSISCAGSAVVIVAVTDSAGRYSVPDLPPGPCSVSFELAGFQKVVRERLDVPAGEAIVVDQQLALAALEETVNVVAPPPIRAAIPPKPVPRVQPGSIPAHATDSVCGPSPLPFADRLVRLIGDPDDAVRTLYAPGDTITIDAGRANGIAVGQNYVVRRPFRYSDRSGDHPVDSDGVHSAGLVQVVEAADTHATVAVVYACDEFTRGDDLDAFVPEPFQLPRSDGPPDFDKPARILLGDEGQMFGAPARMMVIDQGMESGVAVGQRVTLFRRARSGDGPLTVVGEAVVVAVRADWSRIRIESARDALYPGDLAGPHRRPRASLKASAR